MAQVLSVSIGQFSDKGAKETNQDFHGALFPEMPALGMKGIAIALADGISSSKVSQIAAQTTIKSFLTDYYCTSDTWSVKNSGQQVIRAINSWQHAQSKRSQHPYDMDKGYVCTLSAMILKSHHAHIFHIGDCRIYRLSGYSLEQLTTDHRTVISSSQNYLSRAIGMGPNVDFEYQMLEISPGDIFVLATDGVYEFTDAKFITSKIGQHSNDLDCAARLIVENAISNKSPDNVTLQIVRINQLPDEDASNYLGSNGTLPPAPILEARQVFEGYKILRQIHASSRSHIYLARDEMTDAKVALKIPSIDMRGDEAYLKRFIMEEWIARRINNTHVLKSVPQIIPREYIYCVTEFIDGQTLSQWMIDNPHPSLETVRGIVEQIARGLRAFHRKEMLHQDLRPDNIMIDEAGTVRIIDFGATRVAGVVETGKDVCDDKILGTLQYTAPEYFTGETGIRQSDFFSLGVITYQMLTGRLPYGTQVSKIRNRSQQMKLQYSSAQAGRNPVPDWVDGALRKSIHPDPYKRYDTLSEFIADLRTPNNKFRSSNHTPFIERDPVAVWKIISLMLTIVILFLLAS